MHRTNEADQERLTDYEHKQIGGIAAWKSQPPNPLSELWKMITLPIANIVEKLTPDWLVSAGIEGAYDAAVIVSGQQEVKIRAGVSDLAELRDRPLQECDNLAAQVALGAAVLATVEGAATGAGGVLTTLIDVPLLFVQAVRVIRRIGHCYGYPLDDDRSKHFILGVLVAAISGSLQVKRQRLNRLRELEELLIEETQEDILTEELVSLLFQLEIFEEVPGVGAISGGLLNLAALYRVNQTARRVFQERWLRDNGKVETIEPAPAHPVHLAAGWSGALARAAYSASYSLGFAAAVPVCVAAAVIRPAGNVLTHGIWNGAERGRTGIGRWLPRNWGNAEPADGNGTAVPAIANA